MPDARVRLGVRRGAGLLLLGTVLLMLVHALVPEGMRASFTDDYVPQTESLLEGRAFRDGEGRLLIRYPPLQPVLTALVYRAADGLGVARIHGTALVFSGIVAATALLGLLVTLRLSGSLRGGLVTFGGILLTPQLVYASLRPLSVLPFTLLVVAAVLVLCPALERGSVDARRAALAGGLLGAAMLFRPIGILLPVLFAALLSWWALRTTRAADGAARSRRRFSSRKIAAPAVLLLAALAAVAPWEVWLHRQTGEWIPLARNGAMSLRDGLTFNHRGHRDPLDLPAPVAAISDRAWERRLAIDTPGDFIRFLAEELERSPSAVAVLFFYKAARSWYATNTQRAPLELAGMAAALLQGLLTAAALGLPTVRGDPTGRRLTLLLVAVTLYFWAITTMVLSVARYMVPVFVLMPLAWGLAAARMTAEGDARRRRWGRSR